MARISDNQPLIPSVLDRLCDSDPRNASEVFRDRHQQLRQLKASVKRDLEQLLNTRQRCVSLPQGLRELETSLVNYGIPDFVGVKSSTTEMRQHMARTIENVVKVFEPRFLRVKVNLTPSNDPQDRVLQFQIEGTLRADPVPVPVVYHTSVECSTGDVHVQDADR